MVPYWPYIDNDVPDVGFVLGPSLSRKAHIAYIIYRFYK